jgi:tetratricopeptide (TPR) repeat protein
MVNDGDILSKEFLYRFLIYGNKKSAYSMEKFFSYARENREFITNNENNPLIIDFYYQFYLYLLKQKEEGEAFIVLNKLYEKQNEMNARVYSPFVELELARYAKLDDNYDKALGYLEKGLNIKRMRDGKSIDRKIKKEDLAQLYYEIAKIYEYQGKENRYKLMIKKCKNIKDIDSYYKKMCDRL